MSSPSQNKNGKGDCKTTYQRRIERSRALHPEASLSQLRGHPRKGEKPLSELNKGKRPTSKRPWDELSPREQVEHVFRGENPWAVGRNRAEAVVLQEAQLAMLEQEINWGDEDFQTWSHFLPSLGLRPRDFIIAYIRREFKEPGYAVKAARRKAASGTLGVLPPPLDESE